MMRSKFNLKTLPTLLPHSIDWQEFFGNDHPVDLEIGCGRTHFFFDRARNFPLRNIIGVEWKYEFIERGQRRILREKLPNAALFHGNAWLLIPLLFMPQSIDQVFINFPDPWWKERHKKRLVLNDIFLDALKARMKSGGFILLQTDVLELYDFYVKTMAAQGFELDQSASNESIIVETQAQTHREKKCLEQAIPIYRGRFFKR